LMSVLATESSVYGSFIEHLAKTIAGPIAENAFWSPSIAAKVS
jgi:hypothetical protein